MSERPAPNIAVGLTHIHAVITRGLGVAAEQSRRCAQGEALDAALHDGFLAYTRTLVATMHAHHVTEDDLAFPRFRARVPDAPYDLLTAQHRQIAALLDEVNGALDQIAAGQSGAMDALYAALTRIDGLWRPHIGIEEAEFSIERAARLYSVEEHIEMSRAFAEHTAQHSGPGPLAVPFLLYNLPPEDRAVFAAGMPPAVTQQRVPIDWAKQWAPMKPFLLE